MELIYRKTEELKPFVKNPYIHSEKQLRMLEKSIKEFGFLDPIETCQDNMIVAGHARLIAAKNLGIEIVPTIYYDMSYEKAVAYCIANNQIAKHAEEDRDILGELLSDISEIPDFDIEALGFDPDEFDSLLNNTEIGVLNTSDSKIPEDSPEYDESIADEVDACVCPKCGFKFPNKV